MKKCMDWMKRYSGLFFLFLYPILNFYLMEWYTHNPFKTMKPHIHVMNLILFEAMALFLVALFGRIRIALIVQTVFCAVYGLAGYFVLEFRGAPIQPWDLLSISTAASVADNYEYRLDREAVLVLIGFVLLLIGAFFVPAVSRCKNAAPANTVKAGAGRSPKSAAVLRRFPFLRPWMGRLLLGVCMGLLLFGYTKMLHNEEIVQQKLRLYDKLFTPTTIQYKNGTLTAFLMELQYISVDKPDNYSREYAEQLLELYTQTKQEGTDSDGEPTAGINENAAGDTALRPNVIVIMNEAFSDPAVLGDFTTNQDYMPFVHTLLSGQAENTISGSLSVSVKGGNTANTEFEYLTGSTMAFLPYGSIPYQQYIKDELPSLVSHMRDLGYRTVAMHPYRAAGWDRDTVYPDLGFQEMYFQEFYKGSAKVRKYVSDLADYEKLVEIFEKKEKGQPLFLFNVTMQNHSSYSDWKDYDNFKPDITVDNSSSKLLPAYLSLIKLSDEAIASLLNYFAGQEEETIVVFFGDHQPTDSIVNPVLKLHGTSCSELSTEEEAMRYEVPFFIWANYDIEEQSDVHTSANFLPALTLEAAGIPAPAYFNFLTALRDDVPVISASNVTLADGTYTYMKNQKDLLNDYQILQYYFLFDR